jgi:hypothetical protein
VIMQKADPIKTRVQRHFEDFSPDVPFISMGYQDQQGFCPGFEIIAEAALLKSSKGMVIQ